MRSVWRQWRANRLCWPLGRKVRRGEIGPDASTPSQVLTNRAIPSMGGQARNLVCQPAPAVVVESPVRFALAFGVRSSELVDWDCKLENFFIENAQR